jgi:hypothetical protein
MARRTRNTKKRIFAIPAAAPAMPVKPRMAEMIAMTKNMSAQLNMFILVEGYRIV